MQTRNSVSNRGFRIMKQLWFGWRNPNSRQVQRFAKRKVKWEQDKTRRVALLTAFTIRAELPRTEEPVGIGLRQNRGRFEIYQVFENGENRLIGQFSSGTIPKIEEHIAKICTRIVADRLAIPQEFRSFLTKRMRRSLELSQMKLSTETKNQELLNEEKKINEKLGNLRGKYFIKWFLKLRNQFVDALSKEMKK